MKDEVKVFWGGVVMLAVAALILLFGSARASSWHKGDSYTIFKSTSFNTAGSFFVIHKPGVIGTVMVSSPTASSSVHIFDSSTTAKGSPKVLIGNFDGAAIGAWPLNAELSNGIMIESTGAVKLIMTYLPND